MGLNDPGFYNVPAGAAAGTSTSVTPQVTHQETTANLGAGASIDFDFNIDSNPLFDLWIRTDQALTVRVFVRQGQSDVYAQLGNDYLVPANHPNAGQVLTALRVPGSQARIRLLNLGGAPTANLSAQVHSRSL